MPEFIKQQNFSYTLVDNLSQLCRIVPLLEREPAIAVDLEADSLYHYYQKVCLLQISTSDQNFLIDPLAVGDLSPLMEVFAEPEIRKVFHGADYDIRSLNRDFDIEVNSLFDTQIAATFLGIKETGLANLLRNKFSIIIEKKFQKKDWSKRPLPKPMLDYAVNDSLYLLQLARLLEEGLKRTGKLFCVEEECEILSNVRAVPSNNKNLFIKFKGAGRLDSRSLTVLEAILQFRDKKARRQDRPLFKVLGNAQIKRIVREKPRTLKEFEIRKCLTFRQVSGFGRPLLKTISKALDIPEEKLLVYPKKTGVPIRPNAAKRVKALRQWREQCAKQFSLGSSLICTNNQIQALAVSHPKNIEDLAEISEMKNWQKKLFGEEICYILNP